MVGVVMHWVMVLGSLLGSVGLRKRKAVETVAKRVGVGVRAKKLHRFRVYFESGAYVVIDRFGSAAADLEEIASAAVNAADGKQVGRVLAVTVNVDPSETMQQIGPFVVRAEEPGYMIETVEVALDEGLAKEKRDKSVDGLELGAEAWVQMAA